MEPDFDRAAWQMACKKMVDDANRGCGLVYEIFEQRLCASIGHALRGIPEMHRDEAITQARAYGYITPEESAASSMGSPVDDNYCHHGIPPKWCPAGCGDIE
ncbi:CcgAII protein [Paracidovorax avenae]|uniref:CcgAII protein n=1 Tax=Paracidovorax avenae TaxID=80867 RepID=UPI001313DCF3|nr:CcgAII protein [Paracidovorax avenae]